jgi:hypothetical protein
MSVRSARHARGCKPFRRLEARLASSFMELAGSERPKQSSAAKEQRSEVGQAEADLSKCPTRIFRCATK